MTLYYGASKRVQAPSIPLSELGKEFGIGFYAYLDRKPAEEQAIRKAKQGFLFDNPKPTVSTYAFDADAAYRALRVIELPDFDAEWLDFIMQCYTDFRFVHPYDIVIGNAVTAPVKVLLDAYRASGLTKAALLQELKAMTAVKQVCFSTTRALEYVRFVDFSV